MDDYFYTTLTYTTLHYTTLHYTTLHYTTIHYHTLPYPTLPYTTPDWDIVAITDIDAAVGVQTNSLFLAYSWPQGDGCSRVQEEKSSS